MQGRDLKVRMQRPGEGIVRQFSRPEYTPLSPIRDVDGLFAENKENKTDTSRADDLVDELCQTRMSDGHVSLLARVLDLEAKEAERAREFGITTQLIRGIQKRMEMMQGSICDQFEQLDAYCGTMSADILKELKQEIERSFTTRQIDDVLVQSAKRLDALETHARARETPVVTDPIRDTVSSDASDVTIRASTPRPVSVTEFQTAITRLHDRVDSLESTLENCENTVNTNARSLEQIAEPVDEVRVRLEELRLECISSSTKALQDMQARMDAFASRLDAALPNVKSGQPPSHQPPVEAREAPTGKPIYDGCPKSRSLSPRISQVTKTTSYITTTPQRQSSKLAVTPSAGSVSVAPRRSICVRPPAEGTVGSREPRETSVDPKRTAASSRARSDSPTPMTPINYTVSREQKALQDAAALSVQTLDAVSALQSTLPRGGGGCSTPLGVIPRGSSPREQQPLSISRTKSASTCVSRQASLVPTTHAVGVGAQTRRSSPQLRYGHSVVTTTSVSPQGLASDRSYKVMGNPLMTPRAGEAVPRSPNEVIKRFWASYHNLGGS